MTLRLEMDLLLVLLVLICSSDLRADEIHSHTEPDDIRLVGGASRCAGTLELKHRGEWKPVTTLLNWSLMETAVVCRKLDCGFVVSNHRKPTSSDTVASVINTDCFRSGSVLGKCATSVYASSVLEITCSDSVRLVNGTSLCSGKLEVRSNQSDQWSSVCEADFDQEDAEVVCRATGCGPPSALQGEVHGEVDAPTWNKEFQCGGNESALLDCRSSDSARNTCSPVRLICSESVRLVGGPNSCSGTLEVKDQDSWKPVTGVTVSLNSADVICRQLDCGSAVAVGRKDDLYNRTLWNIDPMCVRLGSHQRECLYKGPSYDDIVEITCSNSVRLVNGPGLCSGTLELKSNQSDQWSSVCEADFDLQDAEVVCREISCGPPLALQGELYGEVDAPTWNKEFQCGGNESALLDCRSSDSARNTCSPGKAVRLTCSDTLRLVRGPNHCVGIPELRRQGEWRPVSWSVSAATEVCRELDCGTVVSVEEIEGSLTYSWQIYNPCVDAGFSVRGCVISWFTFVLHNVTCSGGSDHHDVQVQ